MKNLNIFSSYSTLEHHGLYSLSERFQVSENIKTCQWLSRIQGSILFFNVACVSLLVLENVSMNDKMVIVSNVSFNILCTMWEITWKKVLKNIIFVFRYAAVTPIIVIIYTPEWTRETIRLVRVIQNTSYKKRKSFHPHTSKLDMSHLTEYNAIFTDYQSSWVTKFKDFFDEKNSNSLLWNTAKTWKICIGFWSYSLCVNLVFKKISKMSCFEVCALTDLFLVKWARVVVSIVWMKIS